MNFLVVFTGELRDGFDRRQSIALLAQQFSLDFEQVKRLLSGRRPVVKSAPKRNQAERVIRALWRSGWHAEVRHGERTIYRTTEKAPITEAVTARADTGTRRLADGGVAVEAPKSWQLCEGLNVHAVLQAGCPQKDHYLVVLRQSRQELPQTLSLQDYCRAQLQQCVDTVAVGELLRQPVEIAHTLERAFCGEMTAQLDGVDVRYLIAGIECDNWFYSLFLWCGAQEFAHLRPQMMQLIASFRAENAQPEWNMEESERATSLLEAPF
ncbi:hypothetical protein [Microbulbifer sp. SAOS-129_SWC]|uniref:hypothetical protein n=1 Tax=Microbulbifer sp. SAOS-129_SWC TaxID=3145235 RepID=UPI0032176B8F